MSPAVVPHPAIARGQPGEPAAPRAETLSPEQRGPSLPQLQPGSSVRPAGSGPGGGPAVFPMETPPTGKGRTGLVQCLGGVGARGGVEGPWVSNLQGPPPPLPAVTCKTRFYRRHNPCRQSPTHLQSLGRCFRKTSARTSDDGLLLLRYPKDLFPTLSDS